MTQGREVPGEGVWGQKQSEFGVQGEPLGARGVRGPGACLLWAPGLQPEMLPTGVLRPPSQHEAQCPVGTSFWGRQGRAFPSLVSSFLVPRLCPEVGTRTPSPRLPVSASHSRAFY